jgi:putative FmdB family regulatory protein
LPTYLFHCDDCKRSSEIVLKIEDRDLQRLCRYCAGNLSRQVSTFNGPVSRREPIYSIPPRTRAIVAKSSGFELSNLTLRGGDIGLTVDGGIGTVENVYFEGSDVALELRNGATVNLKNVRHTVNPEQ